MHQENQPVPQAYTDYLATYVERDLRRLINIKDPSRFETFLRLLAGRVGQLLNLSSLAEDTGVSSTTLGHWLSVLELVKALWNRGRRDPMTFYRDSNGTVVDMILERQGVPIAVEIKASQTFSPDFTRNLRRFTELVPETQGAQVIYGGDKSFTGTRYSVWGFGEAYKAVGLA